MFFWIGLLVVLVVFVSVFVWAVRGFDDRVHVPGTTHLAPPTADRRPADGTRGRARTTGSDKQQTRSRPTR